MLGDDEISREYSVEIKNRFQVLEDQQVPTGDQREDATKTGSAGVP